MLIVSLLCGLTFIVLGMKFRQKKMLHLLNGVNLSKIDDLDKLAKDVGRAYIILGLVFVVEAILFQVGFLSLNVMEFLLVATVIIGPIILTIVLAQYI